MCPPVVCNPKYILKAVFNYFIIHDYTQKSILFFIPVKLGAGAVMASYKKRPLRSQSRTVICHISLTNSGWEVPLEKGNFNEDGGTLPGGGLYGRASSHKLRPLTDAFQAKAALHPV